MNRLSILLIATLFCLQSSAQVSTTFTELVPPCDSNGVVVVNFSGITPPINVYWSTVSGSVAHIGLTALTDTLYGFLGGSINTFVINTTTMAQDSATQSYNFPFNSTVYTTGSTCTSAGAATLTFTGGSAPYTVKWYNYPAMGYLGTGNPYSLTSGYYEYVATDNAGCVIGYDGTGIVYIDSLQTMALDTLVTRASVCPSGVGSASVTGVLGGTAPYTYDWTNGAGTLVGTGSGVALTSGDYQLQITDASGCQLIANVYIDSVPEFYVFASDSPARCPALGSASVTAFTGGVSPFTYVWTNVATGAVVGITDAISVPTGNYNCVVTDAVGCSNSTTANVMNIPGFSAAFASTNGVCPALGTATITIAGGVSPYTYNWYTIGTGILVATGNPVSLPAGEYVANVTDGAGCTSTYDSAWISVLPDFTYTVTTTEANCLNGTASVTVTGGVSPFTYLWSTGATTSGITNRVGGYYSVTITDASGCSAEEYFNISTGTTVSVTTVVTPATCNDTNGATSAFPSGGTSPYYYEWSNGCGTQVNCSIAPGFYRVLVTDVNGCIGWGESYVNSISTLSAGATVTGSICNAAAGSATVTIAGGTPPYTVNWFTVPIQTGTTATGLTPGTYYYSVTDAAGCTVNQSVIVPATETIVVTATSTEANCAASDGSIALTATGGTPPYSYVWSYAASTTATLASIPAGYYVATVTDVYDCKATIRNYLSSVSSFSVGIVTTPASCLYTSDGTLAAIPYGGTPPYNWNVAGVPSTSSSSVYITGMATGNYWVYASDANGCTASNFSNVGYNVADSSCFCVVKGKVYNDLSRTCTLSGADPGIPDMMVVAQYTAANITFTDTGGNYSFLLPTDPYTLSQFSLGYYGLSPCQPDNYAVTVSGGTGCVIIENFADTATALPSTAPIHDMSINTFDDMLAIPGSSYSQSTIISNHGNVTESNIIASYNTDGVFFAPTAFVPSGIFTGSGYHYMVSAGTLSLAPSTSTRVSTTYNVPTSLSIGTQVSFNDTVAYTPPMSNWTTDYTPFNNIDSFVTTVAASYDPNFKEVSPQGYGPLGYISYDDSILTYMIHFENTGDFIAQNIIVLDTLDPNLNWLSLKPGYMQFPGKVDMDMNGHVSFSFKNIDLPPKSTDSANSNSMFTYSVRIKSGLPIGTTFKNRASIYFDYNAPVMTNQTLNTLWFPESVTNINSTQIANFDIFPNPASNICYAYINSDQETSAEIRITDITGQSIQHTALSLIKGKQKVQIDVTGLTDGLYIATLYGKGYIQTQKLIILKDH